MQILGNRLCLVPERKQEKTMGGIYIPQQSQEERNVGIIVAIGDTCDKKYEGRRCAFTKHTGEPMVYEGIDALLLYSHDIVAFL